MNTHKKNHLSSHHIFFTFHRNRVFVSLLMMVLLNEGCGFHPLLQTPIQEKIEKKICINTKVASKDSLNENFKRQLTIALSYKRIVGKIKCYNLLVKYKFKKSNISILTNTNITRQQYTLVTKFNLNKYNGENVLSNSIVTRGSYNITNKNFSDLTTDNDIKKRLIKETAYAINLYVMSHIKGHMGSHGQE